MRLLRHTDPDFALALKSFNRCATPSADVQQTVAGIIADVRAQGDEALLRLNAKFGGPAFASGSQLRVTREEISQASQALDARMQKALAEAHEKRAGVRAQKPAAQLAHAQPPGRGGGRALLAL